MDTQWLVLMAIYAVVLTGGAMVVNLSGHMALSLAGWFGFSAFSCAMAMKAGMSAGSGLLCGICAGVVVGLLHWLLTLRLSNLSYMLATLALQEALVAAMAAIPLFGGRLGIAGIERFSIDGLPAVIAVLVAFIAGPAILFATSRSNFGRRLSAVQQDRLSAESVGIRPTTLWMGIYGIAGVLIGLGGALYSQYMGAVMHGDFSVQLSIMFLLALIVGRVASYGSPLLGALLLIGLPELLRAMPLGVAQPEFLRNILFACLAVLVLGISGGDLRTSFPRKPSSD